LFRFRIILPQWLKQGATYLPYVEEHGDFRQTALAYRPCRYQLLSANTLSRICLASLGGDEAVIDSAGKRSSAGPIVAPDRRSISSAAGNVVVGVVDRHHCCSARTW
jgi:hypothetical protein